MNRFDQQWGRLTKLARSAPAEADASAPYGFSTRLASAGIAGVPAPWMSFERFAWRGLLCAAVCGVVAMASNLSILSAEQSDIYSVGTTDTIVEMLDIS